MKQTKSKKKIFFWSCDYSKKTGEGNLARKYIKEFYKNEDVKISSLSQNNFLNLKYISPFIGIINCWKYYLRGNRIGYINYLPMWNFLIFLLLPSKTILGPITGGSLFSKKKNLNFFIRKYLFPFFYKISEVCLIIKYKKRILFSTDLLKNNLSNELKKKSSFNFVLKNFKFKKKKKKDNEFIIYYKKHDNKLSLFNYKFIKKLTDIKIRILVVGDKLNIKGVKNLGFISQNKLEKLQSKSKYTLCSEENILSLFNLECISNHVKILLDENNFKKIKYFKKFFIKINDYNLKKL